MSWQPFFSVIINTHNSGSTILSTLQSVEQQKFNDYELIIIDDCSVDDTFQKIKHFSLSADISVKLVRLSKNQGVSYARNRGVDIAEGVYVTFLDGDDLWSDDKLLVEHQFIVKTGCTWVFSNYNVIDSNYQYLGKRLRSSGRYKLDDFIKSGNPVGLLTVAVKKSILPAYPFHKVHHEDYDLWIRLAKNGNVGFLIPNVLATYMKHKSSRSGNKIRSAIWTYQLFMKHGFGFIKSSRLWLRYFLNTLTRQKK